ncbi:Formin-like protein [Arachis hypogaea]|nr:Formin-like protein [Arachis hypogaea]
MLPNISRIKYKQTLSNFFCLFFLFIEIHYPLHIREEPSPSSCPPLPFPLPPLATFALFHSPSPLFTFALLHSLPLHLRSPLATAAAPHPLHLRRCTFVVSAPTIAGHPVESALIVAAQPCRICAHRCLSLLLSLRSPLPRTHHRHLYAPHHHLCAHHRREEESYEALRVFEILAVREKPDVRATTCAKVSVYPREVQPENPNSYRARKREYFRMRHERRKAREAGPVETRRLCVYEFLELMKVPRVESKLRVFSFKIQFLSQVTEFKKSLNAVNSACEEVRKSVKLKEIMKKILFLGNTLNQRIARGMIHNWIITRASNNKMTLMHYFCKVLADRSPGLLDFHLDLVSLEAATKLFLLITDIRFVQHVSGAKSIPGRQRKDGTDAKNDTRSDAQAAQKSEGEKSNPVTKKDGENSTPVKAAEPPPDNEFEKRIRPEVIPASDEVALKSVAYSGKNRS